MLTYALVILGSLLLLATAGYLILRMKRSHLNEVRALKEESAKKSLEAHAGWTAHVQFLTDTHGKAIEGVRSWASTAMGWEQQSRDSIITTLKRSDWNGFVATNVCFPVSKSGTAFIHQVDHLVVSRNGILVVEAKNWDGVIFYGKRASASAFQSGIEHLSTLVDLPPGTPYVVRVKADSLPIIESGSSRKEPTKQARAQAGALSRVLKQANLSSTIPYIGTCVYYSHPRSFLANGCGKLDKTHITDVNGLEKAVTRYIDGCSDQLIQELGDWASRYGADVYGLGVYHEIWQSAFPLFLTGGAGRK